MEKKSLFVCFTLTSTMAFHVAVCVCRVCRRRSCVLPFPLWPADMMRCPVSFLRLRPPGHHRISQLLILLASLYIVLHGLRPAALMIHLEAWDMFPAPCFIARLDCRFTVSMELLGRLSPHRVQDIKSRRHKSRLYRPNNPRCSLEDG